jgi:hypothetical protein
LVFSNSGSGLPESFFLLAGTMNPVKQIVFEVVESREGGYEASALGDRIHTQGDDWQDLKAMV